MSYQSVFKRYELKYILSAEQAETVLRRISPNMTEDSYGLTTIKNIYFDTDNYRLIRNSIDKPVYKEKLRMRSYDNNDSDGSVFVELKKKYEDVVYKRRIRLSEDEALGWLCGGKCNIPETQIVREIDYFVSFYKTLRPVLFLSYNRVAYFSNDGSDFRVTFDTNISCRQDELSLFSGTHGTTILDDGKVLMELKCSGGIPLWMTEILTEEKIYKTSFSKYGTAYTQLIFPKVKEVI